MFIPLFVTEPWFNASDPRCKIQDGIMQEISLLRGEGSDKAVVPMHGAGKDLVWFRVILSARLLLSGTVSPLYEQLWEIQSWR